MQFTSAVSVHRSTHLANPAAGVSVESYAMLVQRKSMTYSNRVLLQTEPPRHAYVYSVACSGSGHFLPNEAGPSLGVPLHVVTASVSPLIPSTVTLFCLFQLVELS